MMGALDGLRVVEIADEISGPYCGKLLVDLGADVTKIEAPDRRSAAAVGPVSRWRTRPRSVRVVRVPQRRQTRRSLGPHRRQRCRGRSRADRRRRCADRRVGSRNPGGARSPADSRLVIVRISNFGQHGPFRDRDATPLTMQAISGWISARDPDRPPVQAGARIAEYVAGAYAALGALTALRIAPADQVTEVDVSELEALLSTLPYPMLTFERMRALGLPTNVRQSPMLGVVRAADGWVGINCLTGQHWLDVCAMLGLSGVRRAAVRDHDGRSRACRVLRGGAAVAGRANRHRHRRTQSGTAHSGGAGRRRPWRAGQSAVRQAGILRRRRREGLVVSTPGPAVSPVEDTDGARPSGTAPGR